MSLLPLPVSRLHATWDPVRIPWADSTQIPEKRLTRNGRDPFQPRAMQALDMAVLIKSPGYNVYLSGEPNLGRRHMLLSYLKPVAKQSPTPPDLVHVFNFADPDAPRLIEMPAGQGKKFRKAMKDLLEAIGKNLQRKFETISFMRQRSLLVDKYQETRSSLMRKMNKLALDKGFNLELDNEGAVSLTPLYNGKKLTEEDFAQLDADIRLEFRNRGDRLAKSLSAFLRELGKAEEALHEKERGLDQKAMAQTLDALLGPLQKRFLKICPDLKDFFADLRTDILTNTSEFMPKDSRREESHGMETFTDRYAINLFVDNSDTSGAPVIVEDNPAITNLLGCMERESEMGALVTDLGLIRAGSLQRANGGYLVLHADELLQHPAAWEGLLRSLRAGQARIEDWSDSQDGSMRARTLRPQPLDLNVKVIIIGNEELYEILLENEERFPKLFRVKAHLDDVTERNASNVRLYLGQIAAIAREADLKPFDATALAWLVDLGSHLSEDQRRLSLQFPLLRELMIEADALGTMRKKSMLDAAILEDAYSQRAYRANLVEETFMEEYDREVIKVRTSGSAIGQVNGLSITWQGNFEFGLPHRISCTVGVGHEGIIDLEREAELGGPIHTKAMMILKSYLTGLFARKKPLVLSASLYFEQSYAGIEGDSASGAELAALISALAETPMRLDLAFTGAVSHSGQIMAVGGVTRKIEGFYKVCARHGLTGSQGVIIPQDNVDNLMLSTEILESVKKGKFAIYSVRNIEEALTLLSGLPTGKRRKNGTFTPGSLYDLADRRLEALGCHAQNAFRHSRKS